MPPELTPAERERLQRRLKRPVGRPRLAPKGSRRHYVWCTDAEYAAILRFLEQMRKK